MQDQALSQLDRLTITDMKDFPDYAYQFHDLASKTGRMYLQTELSEKFFRKLPPPFGAKIMELWDRDHPGMGVGIVPRIKYTFEVLQQLCQQNEINRQAKDFSFCKAIEVPGAYPRNKPRRSLRRSTTYKGGAPHNNNLRKFKSKKLGTTTCKCYLCGAPGHFVRDCKSSKVDRERLNIYCDLELPKDFDVISLQEGEDPNDSDICSYDDPEEEKLLNDFINLESEEQMFMMLAWRDPPVLSEQQQSCTHQWKFFLPLDHLKAKCFMCRLNTTLFTNVHCEQCLLTVCTPDARNHLGITIPDHPKESSAEKKDHSDRGIIAEKARHILQLEEYIKELENRVTDLQLKVDFYELGKPIIEDYISEEECREECNLGSTQNHLLNISVILEVEATSGTQIQKTLEAILDTGASRCFVAQGIFPAHFYTDRKEINVTEIVDGKEVRGKSRMVYNYKRLNDNTHKDQYSLPSIDYLLLKIRNKNVFSKFDLKSGFHQVAMDPESIPWTTFFCPEGHYEWLAMPFGLKNVPAVFQRKMDVIFKDYDDFIITFIDDILIFSDDITQHLHHLNRFFGICEKEGLVLSKTKMKIGVTRIGFLGLEIGNGQVKLQPHIVKKILDFKEQNLETLKGLQQFLGILNYARNYIPNLGKLTGTLYNKCSPHGERRFNKQDWEQIKKIKTLIKDLPPLDFPRKESYIIIQTDGSMLGWGIKEPAPASSETRFLSFGPQKIPILEEDNPTRFKTLKEFPVNLEQQVLLDSLWRAATPTAKLKALNAPNNYFSKNLNPEFLQNPRKTAYVVFRGDFPGLYSTYGACMATIGSYEKPSFKGFFALKEALKTAEDYFCSSVPSIPDVQSYLASLNNLGKTEELTLAQLVARVEYHQRNHSLFKRENKRLQFQISELEQKIIFEKSKEQQPSSTMENLSFESLRHKVSLNRKFRNKFLDQFPEEIQRQIIASTSNACLIKLYDLQRQIIASHRMLDLPLCQYDPDFDNNPSRPVLAQVDLDATPASEEFISKLFFSGFLRQIKCDEPPEFFGPTICLAIQQYKKHCDQLRSLNKHLLKKSSV
ncbi:hypothetical protein RIF29_28013 [Crotalaria pallida]|uniref:Reverse transcriptase n=1 Tax=Crotalaria pallida TaxID=3830 RepID=A0AAN9EQV1_CROPI